MESLPRARYSLYVTGIDCCHPASSILSGPGLVGVDHSVSPLSLYYDPVWPLADTEHFVFLHSTPFMIPAQRVRRQTQSPHHGHLKPGGSFDNNDNNDSKLLCLSLPPTNHVYPSPILERDYTDAELPSQHRLQELGNPTPPERDTRRNRHVSH